jgi:hypothetical protein
LPLGILGSMACVFCGSPGPLSDEDAIPKWALRTLGTLGKIVTRQAPDNRYIRSYTGVVIKFPDVCMPCNTGWMSRLESAVAPWLAPTLIGQDAAFAVPQQQALAFWAVKTGTLYEAAMRRYRHGPPVPAETWAWLYSHRSDRTPPPGTHVWFSKYDPWNPPGDADRFRVSNTLPAFIRYQHPTVQDDPASLHYFHTFTIGYLVVQVFGQQFRPDGMSHDGLPLAVMLPPAKVEPFQVRIWPKPDEVVLWPPRAMVANGAINEFGGWGSALNNYLVGFGKSQRVMLAESDNRARFGRL